MKDDTYPCDCEKEKSVRYFRYLQKGVTIFLVTSIVIAFTLTTLYHLGVRP